LGRECAAAALREGANVAIAARTQETLDAAAAELDPDGKRVVATPTDITDAAACSALVDAAMERFGSVDALVQVAAYEYVFGGLRDSNLDDWRKAFETNVLGALTVLRPVADAMKQSGGGAVVLITNAPRPASGIERMLRRLEVPQHSYDAIVSSGDVTVSLMLERGDKRVHHVGPPRDNSLFREAAERSGRPDPRVPFDEGTLTGALTKDSTWPEGDWRNTYFVPANLIPSVERAEKLKSIMPAGMTLPEMALRFILSNTNVSTIIPGMRKLSHVDSNIAASDAAALPKDLVSELQAHRWERSPTKWSQ